MNNDKKEKVSFIFFLIASICFYFVAVVNFMDDQTNTAVTYFCLGSAFLCLSTTHLNKTAKEDHDQAVDEGNEWIEVLMDEKETADVYGFGGIIAGCRSVWLCFDRDRERGGRYACESKIDRRRNRFF